MDVTAPCAQTMQASVDSDELTAKKSVKAINFTWQIAEVLFFLTL
jgi:hypothetical protein